MMHGTPLGVTCLGWNPWLLTLQQFDMLREVSFVSFARWSMPSSVISSQPDSTTLLRFGICDRLASSSSDTLLQALMSRCCSAGNLHNLTPRQRQPARKRLGDLASVASRTDNKTAC